MTRRQPTASLDGGPRQPDKATQGARNIGSDQSCPNEGEEIRGTDRSTPKFPNRNRGGSARYCEAERGVPLRKPLPQTPESPRRQRPKTWIRSEPRSDKRRRTLRRSGEKPAAPPQAPPYLHHPILYDAPRRDFIGDAEPPIQPSCEHEDHGDRATIPTARHLPRSPPRRPPTPP